MSISQAAEQSNKEFKNSPASKHQAPDVIRYAGYYGMAQGLAGVLFGVYLVWHQATGFQDEGAVISGYGTAAWFLILFGVVMVSGFFLSRGRSWGRGPIVMLQICLMPVAYYMFTSGRPELGAPTALILIVGLVLLFNPTAINWWSMSRYGE